MSTQDPESHPPAHSAPAPEATAAASPRRDAPLPPPASIAPRPSPADGPRRLLLWLGLTALGIGACSYARRPGDQPLRAGDRLTWLQLEEGGGIDMEAGLKVGAVRGEWFSLRPPQGTQDRWLRLRDVKSFSVER